MTKRSIALAAFLLLLMAAALLGLPRMARSIQAQRLNVPVYVTAAPESADE